MTGAVWMKPADSWMRTTATTTTLKATGVAKCQVGPNLRRMGGQPRALD